jgi:alpha-amylase
MPQGYGIPDGFSDCALCQGPACTQCTGSMPYSKAYDPTAQGYAGTSYTRVHRDDAIVAAMRAWMQLPPLEAHAATGALNSSRAAN